MEVLKSTKKDLWLEDSLRRRELIMRRHLCQYQGTLPLEPSWHLLSMMKWNIHQMDVKITFLNGVIEEEVYIEQPQGFEIGDIVNHVCKLKNDMY